MLNESVSAQARQSIEARYRLRDETLAKELDDLAARFGRDRSGEEQERLGVKLRLICERDLFDRAAIAWGGLRRAHEEAGGARRPGLVATFLAELDGYMRTAALGLANQLRRHSAALGPAFNGSRAIDAEWLARLRQRAAERQAQDIETYVASLRRGMPFSR